MPIFHENPTYFTDKSAVASSLNGFTSSRQQQHQQNQIKYGSSSSSNSITGQHNLFGARRKLSSVTSYEDTEDGSELETFLSSYESNNSYNISTDCKIISNNNGSLKKKLSSLAHPQLPQQQATKPPISTSTSSLSRLGLLFKKSKSKVSMQSGGSCGSTVESSGIGSPTTTRTPDSSLSIYTNSLDGDSQSSTNSNQISPKNTNHLEESATMEDRFCSTYAFDDCGIFAANMYYNVGESSVFTIYNGNGEHRQQQRGRKGSSSSGKDNYRDDDEFEDCVQPYYNNTTFSTFPNPKRCSVASAASTTTSSVVPVPVNEIRRGTTVATAATSTVESLGSNGTNAMIIQHDRDGYLRPNEPQSASKSNLRNVKNLYINDSITENCCNGQVHEVQVDVHTPITPGPSSSSLNYPISSAGGKFYGLSNESSAGCNKFLYQFDSAGSTASAATTLVAGEGLPEIDRGSNNSSRFDRRDNGQLPIYMNRAYFGSNSMSSSSPSTSSASMVLSKGRSSQRMIARPTATSVAADCEPYCSLCASSIMGSPSQRSRMDVAIIFSDCDFFSREAGNHIQGFFDKIMTQDKQKLDVALKHYDLKDLDHPSDRVVVHCAKVQIVIISHHFLQRLKDEASRRPRLSPINRVFRSKNVIAVLLAVNAQEIMEGYESVLPRFREWFSVDLRSTNKVDPEFCKKFTEQVIKIYNVELSNTSSFSIFPKKVTKDQPKICIVFKKPVNQDDDVRVELRTQREFKVIENLKLENPNTVLIRIPESLSPDRETLVDVSVFINNNKIGGSRIKSELNLRRFEDDDVDRMSKLLPPFIDCLDKHISETLLKHYKDCTDYTADPSLELMNGIIICKADILPTIMHFSAYYGLPKTAFTVLDEADGLAHCNMKNELGETPLDIAFNRGQSQIGNMIGDYQEISNSYTAYRYIKELIDKNTETGELDEFLEECEKNGEENLNDAIVKDEVNEENECSESATENASEEGNSLSDLTASLGTASVFSSNDGNDNINDRPPKPAQKPTPTTRQRLKHVSYINLNKNPEENPEAFPRQKSKHQLRMQHIRKSILANYDIPRAVDQEYSIPPTGKLRTIPPSIDSEQDYSLHSPVFRRKNEAGKLTSDSGYLIMNVKDGKVTAESEPTSPSQLPSFKEEALPSVSSPSPANDVTSVSVNDNFDSSPTPSTSSQSTVNRKGSTTATNFVPPPSKNQTPAFALDPTDQQLIELINHVKNKTYDMQMVELLFENWKQRPDVQQSIEDKMKMLEKMRDEWRQHHNATQGHRKKSTFERIKSVLSGSKRKKSSNKSVSISSVSSPTVDPQVSTNMTVASPTGLVFTGPTIPTQTFNTLATSPSPIKPPGKTQLPFSDYDPRASTLSHRTTMDSGWSDSSTDSDKMAMGESASSLNRPPVSNSPIEYKNPMNNRFIPQYIHPNPSPGKSSDIDDTAKSQCSSSSLSDSYQVPPPPRPVKPLKKLSEDTISHTESPKLPRKLPVNPEPHSPSLKLVKRPPPAVPAKPMRKDSEPSSPPAPPPRSNNPANVFNFIDYRQKNEQEQKESNQLGKSNYENESEMNVKDEVDH